MRMLHRRCALDLGVRAGILMLLGWAGTTYLAAPMVHAQAASSLSTRPVAGPPATKPAVVTPATRALYGKHCAKCHGADGKGRPASGLFPEIPDFTGAAWHQGKKDAQLLASILDGKGTGMPSLNGKITRSQARDLVGYVRTFAPNTKQARPDQKKTPAGDHFEERYRALHKELDDLQTQFRKLSEASTDRADSRQSISSTRSRSSTAESSVDFAPAKSATPAAADVPAKGELFAQYCVRCHGADGSGSHVRRRQPEIPNFTDPKWQARRSDAQLLTSILDGKGKKMPPRRGKISTEQARGLLTQVRAFASTQKSSGEEQREETRPSSPGRRNQKSPLPLIRKRPDRLVVSTRSGIEIASPHNHNPSRARGGG
jgi:mono/diheme cytochrome c family protein